MILRSHRHLRLRFAVVAALALAGLALLAGRSRSQQFVPTADPEHPRVMYSDSLVSPNDRCMVRGDKLEPSIAPIYVNGVPMGFCCKPCTNAFLLSPETFLTLREIDVRDRFDTKRPAVLDEAHRSFVGVDVFFFADSASKARFDATPLVHAKTLTDPISLTRFAVAPASPHVVHQARVYAFPDSLALREFRSEPSLYETRRPE